MNYTFISDEVDIIDLKLITDLLPEFHDLDNCLAGAMLSEWLDDEVIERISILTDIKVEVLKRVRLKDREGVCPVCGNNTFYKEGQRASAKMSSRNDFDEGTYMCDGCASIITVDSEGNLIY